FYSQDMAEKTIQSRRRRPGTEENDDLENISEDDDKKVKRNKPLRSAYMIVFQVVGAIVGLLVFYLFVTPSPIKPVPIKSQDLPYFNGILQPNNALQQVIKILPGELNGPESIQVDRDGNIYTGLHDGRIIKILPSGKIVYLVRTGMDLPECGNITVEDKCGRPLGLQFDRDQENLIICDAYLGLLKYNLKAGELTTLISAAKGVNDVPFKFVNHLTISSSNKVYFTDSSWKWQRRDFPYMILEGGGQGRLISYDIETKQSEVLMDGLFFPNGIALSPDEEFVVVCETTASRIMRLFLKGSRKGIYDLFSDNLPGAPDNIRPSKDGGYWVALPSIRKWPFSFLDSVGPYPNLKSAIAKLLPKETFHGLIKKYGLMIKLDYYGDIIKSYHDPDGSVITHISEVYEDPNDHNILYFGSFKNDFIGKLRLNSKQTDL
uniref:Strictosidine synthase conserved region domain-containing protein n=1 Tax=Clytia hemisphaerica TaxID=252671 RepID=A0A7M5XF73_9CNID